MPPTDQEHTGIRIAAARRAAGRSQQRLADDIHCSLSMVKKVEQGKRAAGAALVADVARALRIDAATLNGQPYVTELQQDRLTELIRPIREALDLYDLGDDDTLTVRSHLQLAAAADSLCQTVRATRLRQAATELPDLIAETTAAAHRQPATETWQALASLYRTAHDVAVKLGFSDLSTVALDRMAWAADRASDPLVAAARQYMRALVYFREGEQTIGLRLIGAGHRTLDGTEPTRENLAVTGQLHLGAAVLSARARSRTDTEAHLAEAAQIADRTGEAGRVLWMSFGPTNVRLHRVSALIDLRDFDGAVSEGKGVAFPDGWSISRRAHHHVHQANALMETGRHEQALA